MAKGKTPKITRNGKKFTATWSPENSYDDQEIQFFYKRDKNNDNVWVESTKYPLGKGTETKTHTVTVSDFFPGTNDTPKTVELHKVGAKLRYKNGGKWSDWGSIGSFDILAPKPVSSVWCESTNDPEEYTYKWEPDSAKTNTSDSTQYWRRYYKWETCLMPAGSDPVWSEAKTQKINRYGSDEAGEYMQNVNSYCMFADATYVTIREKQADITARKVRWFKVYCVGTEGVSSEKITSQVLGSAETLKPNQDDGSATYSGENDNGTVSGSITIPATKVVKGDEVQIEYAFPEPYVEVTTEGDTVKSKISLPNGFDQWNTNDQLKFPPTGEEDVFTFDLPSHPTSNQVLYLRVNTIRNNITTYGVPFLLEKGVWSLTPPTLSSFSASEPGQPQELTVTVSNIPALGGGNGVFVAVYCRTSTNMDPDRPIGIIPYSASEVTRTFPATWGDGEEVTVGVKAFVADYSPATPAASGTTYYSIANIKMQSSADWDRTTTTTLPKAPQNVRVSRVNSEDTTVCIEWDWTWTDANMAEISWSTNINAWESTSEPSNYTVTGTRVGKRYITDLSADTYYFKVRLIRSENDITSYGPYSEVVSKKISSAPNKPTVILSKSPATAAIDEEITAFWGYESTDGTAQLDAIFAEVTQPEQDGEYVYTEIPNVRANSAKKYTFTPEQFNWANGSTHMISVKTKSGSAEWSDWSNPVQITVTPLPVLSITGIGGPNDALRPLTVDEDLIFSLALVKLPIEFTISGMGLNGQANVTIKRSTDYNPVDPTESNETAYDGETIYSRAILNSDPDSVNVTIDVDDLIGKFDHFANYELDISITDTYGQTVEADPYYFTVYWNRFSFEPDVEIDFADDGSILLTPQATTFLGGYHMDVVNGDFIYTYVEEEDVEPDFEIVDGDLYLKDSDYYDASIDANGDLIVTGERRTPAPAGDYCKIYRLSADKPQLIMEHAEFGQTYVDQYPTYGPYGGYRIVYVSRYGDCVTENNIAAWTDVIVPIKTFLVSIEFGDNLLQFPGNISLSHQWQKDFQLTKYLGGAIEGDWNPGVERSGSINGTIPIEYEAETMYLLRKLADYSGVCHVRTPEGSNFYADVQVQDDREEKWVNRLSQISLTYTKVANRTNDLMLYSDWIGE